MARSLTPQEERKLVRHARTLSARDRALIMAQLWSGFRISEVLALTVGSVLVNGRIRSHVALPPRFLKGHYGTTRTVPIGPELQRALENYLLRRARREELKTDAPLFLSRQHEGGVPQSLCRSSAEKIIKAALVTVVGDPQRLSTHTLRKSFAQRLYRSSKYDILAVRDGLGHSSVSVTEVYLRRDRQGPLDNLILGGDWTRKSRKQSALIGASSAKASGVAAEREPTPACTATAASAVVAMPVASTAEYPASAAPVVREPAAFLPGLEEFAA